MWANVVSEKKTDSTYPLNECLRRLLPMMRRNGESLQIMSVTSEPNLEWNLTLRSCCFRDENEQLALLHSSFYQWVTRLLFCVYRGILRTIVVLHTHGSLSQAPNVGGLPTYLQFTPYEDNAINISGHHWDYLIGGLLLPYRGTSSSQFSCILTLLRIVPVVARPPKYTNNLGS